MNHLQNVYLTIHKIKKDITNDVLATDIIKYITPHFYMNKNELQTNAIGPFVDDDLD